MIEMVAMNQNDKDFPGYHGYQNFHCKTESKLRGPNAVTLSPLPPSLYTLDKIFDNLPNGNTFGIVIAFILGN